MIGELLGSYRVTGQLGSGGMGVVYAAEHPTLGRKAAVKMLRPEFSANAEMVKRFFNEARAATLIKHPGIVAIFDFGAHASGSAFLVMEYLEGESLSTLLRRERRLPAERIVAMARQMASALAAAHAAGIVHRDLKPANLFLVDDPDVALGRRVKVLDFGIAKLSGEAADAKSNDESTASGRIMGTPSYMAPEQCRGAGLVDARADVYALGCILFHMATGGPPFEREGAGDMIIAHLTEAPPLVAEKRPDLPVALARLIDRCLAKPRESRPQTMQEIVTMLDALQATLPRAGTRPPVGATDATVPPTAIGPRTMTMTDEHKLVAVADTAEPTSQLVRRRRRVVALVGVLATGVAAVWLVAAGGGAPARTLEPAASPASDAGTAAAALVASPPVAAPAPDAAPAPVASEATPPATQAAAPRPRPATSTRKKPTAPVPAPAPAPAPPAPRPIGSGALDPFEGEPQ